MLCRRHPTCCSSSVSGVTRACTNCSMPSRTVRGTADASTACVGAAARGSGARESACWPAGMQGRPPSTFARRSTGLRKAPVRAALIQPLISAPHISRPGPGHPGHATGSPARNKAPGGRLRAALHTHLGVCLAHVELRWRHAAVYSIQMVSWINDEASRAAKAACQRRRSALHEKDLDMVPSLGSTLAVHPKPRKKTRQPPADRLFNIKPAPSVGRQRAARPPPWWVKDQADLLVALLVSWHPVCEPASIFVSMRAYTVGF